MLDAHKWVKSKIARRNPGGTADYKLADSMGNPMTLSDLVRPNPLGDATIVVDIISGTGGVRSNPSLPLPTDFTPSPDFMRAGNFVNQLLPEDIDPALVERMVAQEGIFGAVNTLTILLSKRSVGDKMSATTAGLLYAHSALPRKNPGGKTPFLADVVKENYDTEMMIHRFLNDQGYSDVEMRETMIESNQISAKYDLSKRNIEQFVEDVLAPFLAVASGNRGAIKTIYKKSKDLSKKDKETFRSDFEKLMYLLPTKSEDFYVGREYALAASTRFIYPMLAESLLSTKDISTLLGIAKKFPNNLDSMGGIKLTKQENKLIVNRAKTRGWFMTGVRRIPFGIGNQVIRFSDAVTSRRIGQELVSKGRLIKQSKVVKDDEAEAIAQAITARKGGERFGFYKDMGGYFPTPPRGWPPQLIYAIMDAMLEALPDIIDLEDPTNNFESRVNMTLNQVAQDDTIGFPTSTALSAMPELQPIKWLDYKTILADPNDNTRENFLKTLKFSGSLAGANKTPSAFMQLIEDNYEFDRQLQVKGKAVNGKSILELLYEALELAQSKYNYQPSDDDVRFALIILEFSIRKMFGNPGRSAYRFDISLLSSPAGVTNVFDESAKKLIRQAKAGRLANVSSDKIASRFVAVFGQMAQDIYDNAKEKVKPSIPSSRKDKIKTAARKELADLQAEVVGYITGNAQMTIAVNAIASKTDTAIGAL